MKIAIIGGGGTIGSCTAYTLAHRGLADELVLTDINDDAVRAQAMDISTSLIGRQNVVVRAGSEKDLAASDVVIVAASIPAPPNTPREELIRLNLPLVRTCARTVETYCPHAAVIVVTNPIDSLTYAFSRCSQLEDSQLIGYNLNDSMRFQMAVASLYNVPSTAAGGLVLGEHVYNLVMLFSSIRVNGKAVEVTDSIKEKLLHDVPEMLKTFIKVSALRTAGWSSAAGIAEMVEAIANGGLRVVPGSTVLNGQYGYSGISMGVPLALDAGGVKEIIELKLPPDEKAQLNGAAESLDAACRFIDSLVASER